MNTNLNLFKKNHKNIFNILIHIISGFIYLSLISSIFDNPEHAIIVYSIFTLFITKNIFVTLIIYFVLFNLSYEIKKHNLKTTNILIFACIFYFLIPEIGHIMFNENTVLSHTKIEVVNIFINMITFLPYSLLSLE